MVDVGPGVKLAVFGGDGTPGLLKRVLGPPADKFGEVLARWVDFRTENVGRVLENAASKSQGIDEDDAAVSPRVAAHLLAEASYCDDPMVVEYLGGVLASSRSIVGRDDRGARWSKLVTSLSAYEIRLHHVIYSGLRRAYSSLDFPVNWGFDSEISEAKVDAVLAWYTLNASMDYTSAEAGLDITSEAMFALAREGLVGGWAFSSAEALEKMIKRKAPAEGALWVKPSPVGIQLWMWANGLSSEWRRWADPDLTVPDLGVDPPRMTLVAELPEITAPES